jgi:nitrogen fixation/metabolism regulation signal transduction histidine kinase
LVDALSQHLREGQREWREEVRLPREGATPMILMLRGTAFGGAGGMVVVFDDLTELNRAQRDAAWAEVAQRLAHEVKNPLTPIQLSAERLRHRLADKLGADDAALLDRATATIVAQVEALKGLVNAFGDYARTPQLAAQPLLLDERVREVLGLYENDPRMELDADLAAPQARVLADAGKLRQLLHNLVVNALDAVGDSGRLHLRVATRPTADGRSVELRVADNGPGLPAEFDVRWFEPYVSSKPHGTGLGLAVVKKIAEEHGGRIRAGNRAEGGAEFVLLLPCVEA